MSLVIWLVLLPLAAAQEPPAPAAPPAPAPVEPVATATEPTLEALQAELDRILYYFEVY